jgi:hypothetical protein
LDFIKILKSVNYTHRKTKSSYEKEPIYSDNKGKTSNDKLDKLLSNIKIREEQLNKLSPNDSNRKSLKNELDNCKKIAKKIKNKI